tara:strand:+ start:2384 stop:2917 length:534 start_codon:yes stop_codon:yes gene_type:complete
MKKYSVSIPLSDEAYNLAKSCQHLIYDSLSIKSLRTHVAEPHINLISGATNYIDDVVNIIKGFQYTEKKFCEVIGLGVLITPDPLIYLRFTHSVFLRELRHFLFRETLPLWDTLTGTVKDDIWIPKSTLAYKDFKINDLSKAILSLKGMKYQLMMKINELSIIDFTDKEHEIKRISI